MAISSDGVKVLGLTRPSQAVSHVAVQRPVPLRLRVGMNEDAGGAVEAAVFQQ